MDNLNLKLNMEYNDKGIHKPTFRNLCRLAFLER